MTLSDPLFPFRQDHRGEPEGDKERRRGHRVPRAHQAAVRGVVLGVPAARPLRRARHAPDRRCRRHQGMASGLRLQWWLEVGLFVPIQPPLAASLQTLIYVTRVRATTEPLRQNREVVGNLSAYHIICNLYEFRAARVSSGGAALCH